MKKKSKGDEKRGNKKTPKQGNGEEVEKEEERKDGEKEEEGWLFQDQQALWNFVSGAEESDVKEWTVSDGLQTLSIFLSHLSSNSFLCCVVLKLILFASSIPL